MDRPVFIIGGSRTGSEMLKTMLSASDEIDFVDELFLLCPRWLHKDLATNIADNVGGLDQPGALDRLLDYLFSGQPYGWFWSVAEEQLDRAALRRELRSTGLNLQMIFRSIMVVHARMRNKSALGAKFPMHYSYTEKLLEWFPNCRLIHTTRNPKDVYASQSAKYLTPDMTIFGRNFAKFQQFVHIGIQTVWTARTHMKLKDIPNYRLVKYEEVILQPENSCRKLCEFLEIEFRKEMLQPHQYGSSFKEIGMRKGIESSSIGRWKKNVSRIAAKTMDILLGSAAKRLGY